MATEHWDDDTEALYRAHGVDLERLHETLDTVRARNDKESARAAVADAFDAYYNRGEDPGAVASWLADTYGAATADLFVTQWKADQGTLYEDAPATAEEWEVQREQRDLDLQYAADRVLEAQAEAEQRQRANYAAALADELVNKPLGDQLAPDVLAQMAARAQAEGGQLADPVAALDDAYKNSRARYDTAADARFHAEQSAPFRSSLMPPGMGIEKPGNDRERQYPRAETIAAQREQAIQEREALLYQTHHAVVVPARLADIPTEADEQAKAVRAFTAKPATWNEGFAKTGPGATAAEIKARAHSGAGAAIVQRLEGDTAAAFRGEAATKTAEYMFPHPSTTATEPKRSTASTPRAWWLHND